MPIVGEAMRAALLVTILVLTAAGARGGETPCRLERGAVIVPAAFGDIAGDFLIDPSTPKSALHVTIAESFGIVTPTARADLRFASQRLAGLEMSVVNLDARARPFVAGLAGVIGADALAGQVVEIDPVPCRVRLTEGARKPWPIRLPLRVVDGAYAVPAAVSDGVTSRRGWFAVDTASAGVKLADARLTREPPAGAEPDWPPARLRALSLGGMLFEQVPAGLMSPAPTELSGSIGEVIWSRFRLRLDARRGWLELRPERSRRALRR